MKRTILGSRARQLVLGLATVSTLGGGAWWWQHQAGSSTPNELLAERRLEGEEEEDEDRQDRPDLAIEQEVARTLDPALGRVPSERLVAAQQYTQQLMAQRANMRPTAGSLALTQWVERGPANVGGRTRALLVDAADPTGNTVWAGSVGGGLWKTTNGLAGATTTTWQSVDNFFSNLAVTTIAADPRNANTMYFGTGEGFNNADAIRGQGIWKSTNHGATWTQLANTNGVDFQYVQKMLVHPTTGDVYAATRNGLFRSSNGGGAWIKVLGAGTGAVVDRIADLEIAADGKLFATAGIFQTDGIYRSPNGDAGSWVKLNTLTDSGLPTTGYQRIEIACAPSRPQRVYAIMQNTTNSQVLGLYRTDDGGETWVTMTMPGGNTTALASSQAWYDLLAGVSPTNPDVIYVGGLDVFRSTTAGDDPVIWTKVSNWTAAITSPGYLHADHHAIAFATPDLCYFGNDGGVSVTTNASVATPATPAFSTRVTDYNVTQFYACAVHPTDVNYFLAGAQDNGTQKFTSPGTAPAIRATGGDGAFCFIDEDEPQYQFTSYVYAQYAKSVNGGASFSGFGVISSTLGSFINPTDYDSRSNTMFGGYGANQMFRWLNAPTTATSTATAVALPGAGTVTHVTISPGVLNRVYVGTNSGKVLRVDSVLNVAPRTPVVTEIKGTFSGSVSSVAVDKTNEQHLVVTYSNYGVVSVWETTNGGTTWRNVEGNLPDMPIRWALIDPVDGTRVLLATELGVWATDNLSAAAPTWFPASTGLANVRVDMLRMRTADKQIAAATHGRGLYTTDALRVLSTNKGKAVAANGYVRNAYPNPFREKLNVELDRPAAAGTVLTLTDMQGRVVHRTVARTAAQQLDVLPPATLANGAYILQVKGNGQTATRRVIKQ